MNEQPASEQPEPKPKPNFPTNPARIHTGNPQRTMRLPFRILWFLAFHLLLWGAFIWTANSPSRAPSFWLISIGFLIGAGLIFQAWDKLPILYHGLALFVFMPGLILLAPWSLGPGYQRLATTPEAVTVLSSSHHDSQANGGSLPGLHLFSYNAVRLRLADGSQRDGILRPDRPVADGSTIRLNVDPLGLLKPQNDNIATTTGLLSTTLLIALLAEIEMVSALIRPNGASFITAAGRASKPTGSSA